MNGVDDKVGLDFTFNLTNFLIVVGIAMLTSSGSQFVSWFLLYRKNDYQMNLGEIKRLNRKLDKLKSTHVVQTKEKGKEKKIETTKAQLKNINQQVTIQSMKSNLLIGVLMIGVINMIGTYFQGQVIVKLPFEPFSLISGITHRNLTDSDYTNGAYLPIYILSAFIWRTNIKKIFGFQPPKAAVPAFFEAPSREE